MGGSPSHMDAPQSCRTDKTRHVGRRALLLSYITVGYNLVEGVVSVIFGYLAGSPALVGFGLDSFVESASGGVMIWRFTGHEQMTAAEEERAERIAVRLVGGAFFIFAAYVIYGSAENLYTGAAPEPTIVGIVIAVVSIITMPVLYWFKRKTAEEAGSRSLAADSKQTLACFMLSVALLIGLGLNYLFGLWQADPVAGLVIAAFLIKEGYDAVTSGELCGC